MTGLVVSNYLFIFKLQVKRMDPEIVRRYSEEILGEVGKRYGIETDRLHLLDGFESYIFEFSRSDGNFILRLSHSLRRNRSDIQGEVEWINYLAEGGAGVAKAIQSIRGELVEFVDDNQDGAFLATAFIKAPGNHPTKAQWNPRLFDAWGRLVGQIHALSKTYVPSSEEYKRYEWNSAENMQVSEWLSPADEVVQRKFKELMDYLQCLEMNCESYGMIHQDAHAGNFFVDQNYRITLFDFDDCVYGWFIYDIAMVLFYALMGHENDPEYIKMFTENFLRGYYHQNFIDPLWFREVPYFLKLREIDLYAQIYFAFGGFDNINDAWCQNYIRGRKQRIEEEIPYIDFNWDLFTKQFQP